MVTFDPGPLPQRLAAGLAKISMALRSRAWREAGGRGLNPTQGQILVVLAKRPGPQTLVQIAGELAITPATASDALAALEAKGLVRKSRSGKDRRALAVRLTARGRREAERAAGWPDFLAEAAGQLDVAEQTALLRALIKMIRTLQERGDIAVARMCVTCRFFRPHRYADPIRPHHCDFVDAPFGDRELRVDCADHQPAAPDEAQTIWQSFLRSEEARP
ncbi:MAG: MarR family winged helix-turn-helix transcriptional regulator [Bryobacteraceae bacterium]|jgi:DNA-binding MarR family transcriptional regulator|nr:MarR family winged helix-turn-helix transcriptional regulator [Bryobacteraceae bacterium]